MPKNNKIYSFFNNVLGNIVSILPSNLPRVIKVISGVCLKILSVCSIIYVQSRLAKNLLLNFAKTNPEFCSAVICPIFAIWSSEILEMVCFFDINSIPFFSPEDSTNVSNFSFELDLNNLSEQQQKELSYSQQRKLEKIQEAEQIDKRNKCILLVLTVVFFGAAFLPPLFK